jgi:aspartate racemase
MGPLASAAFMQSLYRAQGGIAEQEMIRTILLSDPSLPDRTAAVDAGGDWRLVEGIANGLARLIEMGCSRSLVVCMTSHAVLRQVPPHLTDTLLSLVELTYDAMGSQETSCIVLSTLGCRRARVLESADRWATWRRSIVYPAPLEAEALHQAIYDVKANGPVSELATLAGSIVEGARVERVVFACTELHLLHGEEELRVFAGAEVIDPLAFLCRHLWRYLGEEQDSGAVHERPVK